jgi:hypothetical protein
VAHPAPLADCRLSRGMVHAAESNFRSMGFIMYLANLSDNSRDHSHTPKPPEVDPPPPPDSIPDPIPPNGSPDPVGDPPDIDATER